MITLHILQLLEDNGFGNIAWAGNDGNLYWEKMPKDTNGIWVISRGQPTRRGMRRAQTFDLYARGSDDVDGARQLTRIMQFFRENYATACRVELPSMSSKNISGDDIPAVVKLAIEPSMEISNAGQDANDRIIWNASAVVTYNKE